MTDAFLALGSNLGDRDAALRSALRAIAALADTRLLAQSPIYETQPLGPQDQGPYLNMATHIRTQLQPIELVRQFQTIERELGRAKPSDRRHWGPREIDIDLLLFGEEVIHTPTLTVPHPGLHERWFVLKPLSDIAPQVVHPLLGRSILELLSAVDASAVVTEARP